MIGDLRSLEKIEDIDIDEERIHYNLTHVTLDYLVSINLNFD